MRLVPVQPPAALPPSVAQKAATLQARTPQGIPGPGAKQLPGQPRPPLPGMQGQPLPPRQVLPARAQGSALGRDPAGTPPGPGKACAGTNNISGHGYARENLRRDRSNRERRRPRHRPQRAAPGTPPPPDRGAPRCAFTSDIHRRPLRKLTTPPPAQNRSRRHPPCTTPPQGRRQRNLPQAAIKPSAPSPPPAAKLTTHRRHRHPFRSRPRRRLRRRPRCGQRPSVGAGAQGRSTLPKGCPPGKTIAVSKRSSQSCRSEWIGGGRSGLAARSSSADIETARRSSARDQRGADSAAAAICSGLIGVELNSILNGASASDTALAMTTGGEMAPPSPTPLTPSGLSGEGEC